MLLNECRIIAENDEWITHSNCVGNTNVIIFDDYPYNRNDEFTDLTRAYRYYKIRRRKMILAIIERIENIKEKAPFNNRYYLTEHFKKIFDELDILLFPIISSKNLEKVCDICDGLIVTGSCIDIPPHYYNENPIPSKNYDIDEFKLDKEAIKLFSNANKPILGICGGLQSINVYFGGSLNQKIENHDLKDKLHKIYVKDGTFLNSVYKGNINVNSFHKQSIKDVANQFIISAESNDGTIEAIEKGNIIAVQWHPEEMNDILLFEKFINTFFD